MTWVARYLNLPASLLRHYVSGRVFKGDASLCALSRTTKKLRLRDLSNGSAAGQLAAFVQQRICHVYRRKRTAPFPSRMAQRRNGSQFGVDNPEITPHCCGLPAYRCVNRTC